jgi:hypothetical protein
LCPNNVVEQRPCFVRLCEDCNVGSISDSSGSYCFNDGECVDDVLYDGLFTCNCSTGFLGDGCTLRLLSVKVQCCLIQHLGAGDCLQGSNGPNRKPCANFGTCVDSVPNDNAFTCDCSQVPFEGANCELSA